MLKTLERHNHLENLSLYNKGRVAMHGDNDSCVDGCVRKVRIFLLNYLDIPNNLLLSLSLSLIGATGVLSL